jgi:hypothetical protein
MRLGFIPKRHAQKSSPKNACVQRIRSRSERRQNGAGNDCDYKMKLVLPSRDPENAKLNETAE